MTAPCDTEGTPEAREEEQEIVLRLGDILPRVPGHLLKPGPHEPMSKIRFSVDELAEKISRGRASVPLERLASVCPDVFRNSSGFPGEQEIQLPLQKLLEQVGLVAPKASASNGMPKEQLTQARAQAGKIIEGAAAAATAGGAAMVDPFASPRAVIPAPISVATPAAPLPATPSVAVAAATVEEKVRTEEAGGVAPQPARIAKAISAARQILGIFARATQGESQAVPDEKHAEEKTPVSKEKAPAPAEQIALEKTPAPEPVATAKVAVEPVTQPVPAGCVSLRVLPIYRLLPSEILWKGPRPSETVRAVVPLAAIDAQLAGGHVEIPLGDFIKALPEDLRGSVNEVPDTQVWIPLDEIFQNLPPDHLFHMPALGAEVATGSDERFAPAKPEPEKKEATECEVGVETAAEPSGPIGRLVVEEGDAVVAEPAKSTTADRDDKASDQVPSPAEPAAAVEETPEAKEVAAEAVAEPSPEILADVMPEAVKVAVVVGEIAGQKEMENLPAAAAPAESAPISQEPETAETFIAPQAQAERAPELPAASPAQTSAQAPARAPWMRGFQVPPPRLFSGSSAPAEAPSEGTPAEAAPQPAATPEAKRTADFLANQNGIFAAAAFVQGAVFASADFPRKPDLDALRDFMGSFVDHARESGQRLGWNRVLTIACEGFHATAVVRDTHFIVALHYDRVLPTLAHDALILAADDLSRAG